MTQIPVKYEHGVTLVGGGPVKDHQLASCLSHAPLLVAADGGADQASALGHIPNLIVGDLDSLVNQQTWRDSGIQILEFVEQETTDFEKCLYGVEADFYLCAGFLGGRLDHELAALSALVSNPQKPIVLVGQTDACFHCPPNLSLELEPKTRVSLFPMRSVTATSSAGLHWPVDGLTLSPGTKVGTSNRATGSVQLSVDTAGLLVILPVEALSQGLQGLLGSFRRSG